MNSQVVLKKNSAQPRLHRTGLSSQVNGAILGFLVMNKAASGSNPPRQ